MASTHTGKPVSPEEPLIVVVGATGAGKSQLALEIASSLEPPGEIINADAMQLYTGLPIITNKLSKAEQKDIPHHLLGTIGLEEQPWTVTEYVRECDRVIKEIRERGRIPIVVGGTSYYVHGLLLKGATLRDAEERGADPEMKDEEDAHGKAASQIWPILDAPTEKIYAKLKDVDPIMAQRWHPNDRRKIQRSLEIWLRTGNKASEMYAEQADKKKKQSSAQGRTGIEANQDSTLEDTDLRYSPLILWLDAEDAALKTRLNSRVDDMVRGGLIDEAMQMVAFEQDMKARHIEIDKTKGIWKSIGYKEIEPWVEHVQANRSVQKDDTLLDACVEAVKGGTRRYAKRQNRYVRIRLANALADANSSDKLFLLDCTDLQEWHRTVREPALSLVASFLQGGALPSPATLNDLARRMIGDSVHVSGKTNQHFARRCDVCDKVLMTEAQWLKHLESRSHKKVTYAIRQQSQTGLSGNHKSETTFDKDQSSA